MAVLRRRKSGVRSKRHPSCREGRGSRGQETGERETDVGGGGLGEIKDPLSEGLGEGVDEGVWPREASKGAEGDPAAIRNEGDGDAQPGGGSRAAACGARARARADGLGQWARRRGGASGPRPK